MRIIIRTDASYQIGSGHVMRCLTLTEAIRVINPAIQIAFVTRPHAGNLNQYIRNRGFTVYSLPRVKLSGIRSLKNYEKWLGTNQEQDADETLELLSAKQYDWLVTDHYALDSTWEKILSPHFKKIMAIDDLANRNHHCHLLLDQNLGHSIQTYRQLVPDFCKILAGPTFALLRPEFNHWREYSLKRRQSPSLKQLIITMGGVDKDNYTGEILKFLKTCKLPENIKIIIVMGATAPHLKTIQTLVENYPYKTRIEINVSNMAELMANSDLAIGAAGSSSWERCCLGLPTIQIVIAENQQSIAQALTRHKAIKFLDQIQQLEEFIDSCDKWMIPISQSSQQLCDGLGAHKVTHYLINNI